MAVDFNKIPSPCFVLDEKLLIKNLQLLEYVRRKAGIEIIVALKGYAFWYTFPLIKKYLDGATASSLNEAILINEEMGVKAHTYAPVYSEREFGDMVKLSSHITFNSLTMWEKYKYLVPGLNAKVSCGLRINPEYSEVETPFYNPGSPESRLGIKAGLLGNKLPQGIEGLHFHLLCENDSYVLERTLEKTEMKFSGLFRQVRWLNMGGGHLITHPDYDVEHLITLLKDFKKRYPNIESIILEPGEAIGYRTGYLVADIEDIIEHDAVKIAMLNVSFAAHMPDCLEMPYKPAILGASDKPTPYKYRMGGTTCLAGDFMGMGDYFFPKPLQPGDKIIFEDMIHYTMVKTLFFNGVKHPDIGVWTEDKYKLLRTFNYKDYKFRLS
ncbi:MAG: Carboxynorspermidine/carboxyspermidine decarboxylase [Bacteroidetes bacterium ADurb.Bin408]|nr:MAG: Carboxynorspermidine/carboxyspermidine decarboxylase [Bacteroidetes bacterium ADurb.Bin408]